MEARVQNLRKDPDRKGFFNLPREVRDVVYEYVVDLARYLDEYAWPVNANNTLDPPDGNPFYRCLCGMLMPSILSLGLHTLFSTQRIVLARINGPIRHLWCRNNSLPS